MKDTLILEPVKDLPDGSFLADVFDSIAERRREHPVRSTRSGRTHPM